MMSLQVYAPLYPCALFQLKTHFSNKFGCIEPSEEAAPIPSHIVDIRPAIVFGFFEVHTEHQIDQILIHRQ